MASILIVDDSSVTRKVIKKHLSNSPYASLKMLEAPDGEKALEIVKTEPVDVILSDWNMPKMNGLEFSRAVREYEKKLAQKDKKQVQIIMITTEGTIEKVTQAMESGVNEYIVKPFTADTLTKTLKKVFPMRV